MIPAVRMRWAALGVARPPAPNAVVFGDGRGDSTVQIWRFAQDGDTLDYRDTRGGARVLEAEWRREGRGVAPPRPRIGPPGVAGRGPTGFSGGGGTVWASGGFGGRGGGGGSSDWGRGRF